MVHLVSFRFHCVLSRAAHAAAHLIGVPTTIRQRRNISRVSQKAIRQNEIVENNKNRWHCRRHRCHGFTILSPIAFHFHVIFPSLGDQSMRHSIFIVYLHFRIFGAGDTHFIVGIWVWRLALLCLLCVRTLQLTAI